MAEPLPLPKGYQRLGAFPIDKDSVFTDLATMEAYIAGGSSYAGQVVALVDVAKNEASLFKVLPDKTYDTAGGPGISQERFSLIGHTVIPTAFERDVKIVSIPKFNNLETVKLVNIGDASEIILVAAATVQQLPIIIPAGDYEYRIVYVAGAEAGTLIINF